MMKCKLDCTCCGNYCCFDCPLPEKEHCSGCDYKDSYEFGSDCPFSYEDPEEHDEE